MTPSDLGAMDVEGHFREVTPQNSAKSGQNNAPMIVSSSLCVCTSDLSVRALSASG